MLKLGRIARPNVGTKYIGLPRIQFQQYGNYQQSAGAGSRPAAARVLRRSAVGLVGLLVGVGLAKTTLLGYAMPIVSDGQLSRPQCEAKEPAVGSVRPMENDENPEKRRKKKKKALKKVILEARDIMERVKDEVGSPGLVVAVSVDGKTIWAEGLGYADVENRVPCHPNTVMRIASISKPITMAVVAKLWEAQKLDLDKPVTEYVKNWPEKDFKGEKVVVTTRQLVSHLGGIRHYTKCKPDESTDKNDKNHEKGERIKEDVSKETNETRGDKSKREPSNEKNKKGKDKKGKVKSEFELEEYCIRNHYECVTDALELFKDDCLCSKPGTTFLYTTHGWSLVSAVAEGASGHKFPVLLQGLFKDLGLKETYLDENDSIIYNRARFYQRNEKGRLVNAPYVDCSYKWAGGGLLSTVKDLNAFGNAMLYSFQRPGGARVVTDPSDSAEYANAENKSDANREAGLPGYLHADTLKAMWTPVENTPKDIDRSYGMGWAVIPDQTKHGACEEQDFYVKHSGGAIGASSVLLILPRKSGQVTNNRAFPQGVVVSVTVNLQSVSLFKAALKVAEKFKDLNL